MFVGGGRLVELYIAGLCLYRVVEPISDEERLIIL
jgi:hypothetical protein